MVANIRSGSSPGGALRYNKEKEDKDEAEVLFWQKMLEPFDKHGRMDIDACMESFWPYLEANRRTTNTVFHASLNPSPEDRLTDEQLRKIACEYMERMGYGNQPYIVFKHKDIERQHLHIVSLRVDEQGRKISDPHEYDRSMSVLRICNQNCKHADRIGSICNKAYHICNNRYRNVAHDRLFLSYQNKSTNLI